MIYLDNSATSFYKPGAVIKAVSSALKNPVNIGRSVSRKAFLYSRKIYNVRELICEFIGGKEAESVIFTNNATTQKSVVNVYKYASISAQKEQKGKRNAQ